MKAKGLTLALSLMISIGLSAQQFSPSFSQIQIAEHQHGIEEFFTDFTLLDCIEQSNLLQRYSEESAMQSFVDQQYDQFYVAIEQLYAQQGNQMSHDQFESLKNTFLSSLVSNALNISKVKDLNNQEPEKLINGPCVNMDFETGNYTGWTSSMGFRTTASLYDFSAPITLPASAAQCAVVTPGVDPNVAAIQRVFPGAGGGTRSLRLGSSNLGNENRAVRLEQTFLVDNFNKFFTYHYAVIFEAPVGHTPNERPYFIVDIIDQNGAIINCGHYDVVVDGATVGDFQTIGVSPNQIFYKNWTTVFTNLSAYIGQNVTVRFQVGDCELSGHQAYAYIEASCNLQQISATPGNICPGETTTLTAPGGVGSFLWNTGATTQSIVTGTPGLYTVDLIPVQGPACMATLDITVTQNPDPVANYTSNAPLCFGNPVNFNSTSTIPNPGVIQNYQWFFGDGINTPLSNGTISAVPSTSGNYTAPVHTYAAAGTYNVTLVVESVDGCLDTLVMPLTVYPAPTLSETHTNVSCNGGNNGAINLTVSGGTAPFNYSWSNGATTEDITGLTAGNYTINLTDANGCPASTSAIITQPVAPLALSTTQVNVLCFGGATGSINLTVSGGTAPYTYAWSNGATVQDISALTAGAYAVTVTDANGCTANINVIISQPVNAVSGTSTQTNVLCFGASTGAIDITPSGGTAPYTYLWNTGATTQDISGLPAGNYTVTINDANGGAGGCTATLNITITQPAAAVTLAQTHTNLLCNGASNGLIDLTPAGGTAPYTYSWSNGATTQDIAGLSAGTYTVIVNDANGSTGGCTATMNVNITQPAAPVALSETHVNVLCNGGTTGSINLTVNGGTAPYTYSWSNGATTQDISSLAAGTYTVTVNDANGSTGGCTATMNVNITQPAAALTLSETHVNVLCNGGTTGSIDLTPSGGTAPYTYSWSNGATTQDISGLGAGSYTVTVNDANGSTGGCTATMNVNITQPALPVSLAQTHVNILCNGASTGSINITPSGGTAPYTYLWNTGATTEDLSAIPAGNYTIVVNDANGSTGGCTSTLLVTVTQPAQPVTVSTTQTNVLCNGGATGAVNLTVNGGTAPYAYSWSNGAVTEDISGLVAGNYSVVVTDALGSTGGCTASTSVTITQPAAPVSVSETHVNVLCNGNNTGSINITPSGGTVPYTYSWSNGATSQDIGSLTAGSYTVIINDVNGSTGGCTATITVNITQPTALTQSISSPTFPSGTNISCFGLSDGNVNLTIGGGALPYSYLWNTGATTEDLTNVPAGNYSVIVTDANGCQITSNIVLTQPPVLTSSTTPSVFAGGYNLTGCLNNGSINLTVNGGNPAYTFLWSNGAVSEDISALAAGNYSYTVTDVNGCQTTGNLTLTAPPTLTNNITAFVFPSGTNISCFGLSDGNIDLTVNGGTPPYSYLWNTGATTQDLPNVPAGNYSVTITDANGCTSVANIVLTQPTLLSNTMTPSVYAGGFNVSGCTNDGSIDLNVLGGNPAYTYLWSTGATTEDLSNLIAGTYNVIITDVNGCQNNASITLTQPGGINQSVTAFTYPSGTNISCFGLSDGSIDLTVSGGVAPYSFLWNTGAVTEDITALPFGNYSVTITDANGCQASASIVLTQPTALQQTIASATYPSGTNISCFGLSDGNVDLTISGGNPGYTYAWNSGATTQDLPNVPAGNYNVTVTDVNGCQITSNIILTQPTALTQSISAFTYPSGTNISCFGLSDGSIDLTIGGGSPVYTYAWSNGANIQDLTNVPAGNYNVTVTDMNGCQITSNIILTQPTALTQNITAFTYPSGTNISCFGLNDGSIDLTIGGGNPAYTYLWNTGATTQDLASLIAGNYNVTVTDVNGCQITSNIILTQPTTLTESITAQIYPSGDNISCFGLSDGNIDLSINGGNPAYSYLWNTGATTQDLANVPVGSYNVTVTDVNGCQITSNINLTEPPVLTSNLVPSVYAGGYNVSGCNPDGTIDLTVNGGSPVYIYAWSNGSNNEDLSLLPAGNYSVTITDINGCQITDNIVLTGPTNLTSNITAFTYPSGTNISCFGLSDGSIDLTVSNGVAPYTYSWSTGATTEDITGLPAGNYNVVITDANGCQINNNITLNQPPALNQGITALTYPSGTNISCFGFSDGSIDLTIGGGNPAYTYLWNTGATTEDINGLPVGAYNVTVTDMNGCQITSNIVLTQPTPLNQSISSGTYPSGNNVSCFGFSDGNIDLSVNGGSPGYTYLWNTGATTEDLTNVPAGVYNVTILDLNGCNLPSTITLDEPTPINPSVVLSVYAGGFNVTCQPDGFIDLTVIDGSPGYTYLWTNGATTQDINNLAAGFYEVTITDINGCVETIDATLIQAPDITTVTSVTTNYNGQDISCFGFSDGGITVNPLGGAPSYTYVWTNSSGTQVGTTQSVNGLPVGEYFVEVTDQNGCIKIDSITLTQPTDFTTSVIVNTDYNGSDISCVGAADGGLDLTVSGATPAYSFSWTDALSNVVSIQEDPFGLPAGTYTITITDLNGCVTTDNQILVDPPIVTGVTAVTSDYNGQDVSCFGSTNGSVNVIGGGGTPGYTYMWLAADGTILSTTDNLTNIGAGTYYGLVTDANGCVVSIPQVVTEPAQIALTPNILSNYFGFPVSCINHFDGVVDVTVNGGTPNYTYAWNGGPASSSSQINNLGVGVSTVLLTDANGCTATTSVDLDANPNPTVDLPPVVYSCEGLPVTLNSNSEPGSNCQWVFSDGTVVNDCGPFTVDFGDEVTCHDVQLTVTNAIGCMSQMSLVDFVCIVPNPIASFTPSTFEVTTTNNDVFFSNTSEGANVYHWNFGDGSDDSQEINPHHAYNITSEEDTAFNVVLYAVSTYGCVDSTVRLITIGDELIFWVPNTFTPDDDAFNNEFKPVFSTGYDEKGYTLLIFNRWGELIFESHNTEVGWDGSYGQNGQVEMCQDGTYTWKIVVKLKDKDDKVTRVGHVNLLR